MVTSGTTGTSKKILRAAGTEAGALPLHADINEIDSESIVYVMNFPVWTAGGYRWPLITWSAGGTVVIHQKTNHSDVLTSHCRHQHCVTMCTFKIGTKSSTFDTD